MKIRDLMICASLALSAVGNASADTTELPAIQQKVITIAAQNSAAPFTEFPEAYCNVRNVEAIYIYANSLTSLPSCISRFGRTLRKFSIENNPSLTALPAEVGAFSFLEMLSISGTGLTTLPVQIANDKAIRNLNLAKNKLTAIPKEIGQLVTLEVLDLSGNQLTSDALPAELGYLTSLRVLNLANNKLTKAPNFLPYLVNLQRIIFTGNAQLSQNERDVITAILKDRPSKEAPTQIEW